MTELTERGKRFHETISKFIITKLNGKAYAADAVSPVEIEAWLKSAVERVHHLEVVTHVLKATHPSAKGSNIYAKPCTLVDRNEVGTHSLGGYFDDDIAVDNARHLDVYSLLKQTFEGQRLLDWILAGDKDLRSALHECPEIANLWMSAFQSMIRTEGKPTTHKLAKQIYWLTGANPSVDSHYHLLQPMFSSSLESRIHSEINSALWAEPNKSAWQAYKGKKPSTEEFRSYRNLAVRILGGSNQQNVSQRNQERKGKNYLLASLPPHWKSKNEIKLRGNSALDAFLSFGSVRKLVKQLSDLLLANPDPTMQTRQSREAIEQALGAQLAAFGEAIQEQHASGWTQTDCELDINEQLWLDQKRTELAPRKDEASRQEDENFNATFVWGDWPDVIAGRFANWLNARLREAGLVTVGDSEAKHWARQAIIDVAWPIPLQRRMGDKA